MPSLVDNYLVNRSYPWLERKALSRHSIQVGCPLATGGRRSFADMAHMVTEQDPLEITGITVFGDVNGCGEKSHYRIAILGEKATRRLLEYIPTFTIEIVWQNSSRIGQGHLVKGEDTEAFSSPLWSRNCTSKTVGARPNLRPHLK
jgi:hypothetical protein